MKHILLENLERKHSLIMKLGQDTVFKTQKALELVFREKKKHFS